MDDGSVGLLREVTRTLNLDQKELAQLLGTSLRTVQRIYATAAWIDRQQYVTLARAVYAKNPKLAAELAARAQTTPQELGIAPPPPSRKAPEPAPAPSPPSPRAADSVLCAAADVMNLPPRSVRPALTAAFVRARELGLSVETVAAALQASEDEEPPKVG